MWRVFSLFYPLFFVEFPFIFYILHIIFTVFTNY
uniref:Uncharacterized protein n=1 Tax=Myoviridae sp. ctAys2 TaxID=2825044 RepID=A0A8S5Q3G9_9CAUD|nr:MAG TPA: hypothetical protein [Myoviridae sp. ctAys2]